MSLLSIPPNMNMIHLFLCITLLFLEPSSLSATVQRCHPNEKKALLSIKKAFKNPSILTQSWLPETDCCQNWYGVSCSAADNHVIRLEFMNKKFHATPIIPDTIGNLPNLTTLRFYNITGLSGQIPISITKLLNLTTLEITFCNLTGPIPEFLSNLTKLTFLNLSHNKLTGPIPASLSEIPGLGVIQLERNRLTGPIPETFLKLKHNNLCLILSHNRLSGEIPPSFRDFNFACFEVSQNKLSGDVSMLFGADKGTFSIDIARNMFEFDMSGVRLNPNLVSLDMSHNKIYGRLPKDFVKEWVGLDVSYNRLCGPIPQGWYLQEVIPSSSFLHNRCLCGAPLNVTCNSG